VTYNLSSGGAFFEAGMILPVGKHVQLIVDWPALLDHHVPLTLNLFGDVVRSDETGTAMMFSRKEWRIRHRSPESG